MKNSTLFMNLIIPNFGLHIFPFGLHIIAIQLGLRGLRDFVDAWSSSYGGVTK